MQGNNINMGNFQNNMQINYNGIGNNINMNNDIMMNLQLINNQNNNNITVFSTDSISNDYFAFSFDNLLLYYSSEQKDTFPKIDIKYDIQRQSLFGNEVICNNQGMQTPISNQIYKLSGKNNFNIDKYELYEIQFN